VFRKILLGAVAPAALVASAWGFTDTAAAQRAPTISASERQQALQQHPALVTEFGGAVSGRQASYVAQVGTRVGAQSGLGTGPGGLNLTLLNSPVNNAFAVPGGYVYVTRQLVALMNDEAELAAVLGHEVAHVAARHGQRRQSAAQRNSILGALGQVLVGAVAGNSGIGRILGQGIGTGAQLATLGYSRSQETESDVLGVQYLVRSGYDPSALASMLRSLAAQQALDARISGGDARSVPEWASTHPNPASRVQRALQEAGRTRAGGQRNREAFLAAIDGMLYGDDPRQGIIEGRDFLHPDLRIAFTIPQGFTMQNGASAVTIGGPNTQAQLRTGRFNGNLEAYIAAAFQELGGNSGAVGQLPVERTSVNGIPAAYAQIRANSGRSQVDVTVFAYAPSQNQAYHFVILTPAGRGIGAAAPMLQSFRTLSTQQAAAIRPRYLRVVTVGARDTAASLAQRMAFPSHQLERFLVLNGLDANARLTAGQRVKIVTY
jgi:predicted Zn-dependent protease